jgi:hypothetical protein
MNNSIQQLTAIAADLNAAGKEVNLKVLPTRGPRKGETWERQSQHGAGRAMGQANNGGEGATGATTCGGGKGMNLNRVYGYGARMVADLDATIARYNAQIRADKIADRRAERLGIA